MSDVERRSDHAISPKATPQDAEVDIEDRRADAFADLPDHPDGEVTAMGYATFSVVTRHRLAIVEVQQYMGFSDQVATLTQNETRARTELEAWVWQQHRKIDVECVATEPLEAYFRARIANEHLSTLNQLLQRSLLEVTQVSLSTTQRQETQSRKLFEDRERIEVGLIALKRCEAQYDMGRIHILREEWEGRKPFAQQGMVSTVLNGREGFLKQVRGFHKFASLRLEGIHLVEEEKLARQIMINNEKSWNILLDLADREELARRINIERQWRRGFPYIQTTRELIDVCQKQTEARKELIASEEQRRQSLIAQWWGRDPATGRQWGLGMTEAQHRGVILLEWAQVSTPLFATLRQQMALVTVENEERQHLRQEAMHGIQVRKLQTQWVELKECAQRELLAANHRLGIRLLDVQAGHEEASLEVAAQERVDRMDICLDFSQKSEGLRRKQIERQTIQFMAQAAMVLREFADRQTLQSNLTSDHYIELQHAFIAREHTSRNLIEAQARSQLRALHIQSQMTQCQLQELREREALVLTESSAVYRLRHPDLLIHLPQSLRDLQIVEFSQRVRIRYQELGFFLQVSNVFLMGCWLIVRQTLAVEEQLAWLALNQYHERVLREHQAKSFASPATRLFGQLTFPCPCCRTALHMNDHQLKEAIPADLLVPAAPPTSSPVSTGGPAGHYYDDTISIDTAPPPGFQRSTHLPPPSPFSTSMSSASSSSSSAASRSSWQVQASLEETEDPDRLGPSTIVPPLKVVLGTNPSHRWSDRAGALAAGKFRQGLGLRGGQVGGKLAAILENLPLNPANAEAVEHVLAQPIPTDHAETQGLLASAKPRDCHWLLVEEEAAQRRVWASLQRRYDQLALELCSSHLKLLASRTAAPLYEGLRSMYAPPEEEAAMLFQLRSAGTNEKGGEPKQLGGTDPAAMLALYPSLSVVCADPATSTSPKKKRKSVSGVSDKGIRVQDCLNELPKGAVLTGAFGKMARLKFLSKPMVWHDKSWWSNPTRGLYGAGSLEGVFGFDTFDPEE